MPTPMNVPPLQELAEQQDFSGALRIMVGGEVVLEFAAGYADRANARPNTLDTRFGVASVTKGLTALTVMTLIEDGVVQLDTPVRAVLGTDLAMIDDHVTLGQLMEHRSGIGDYLDEELLGDIDDHVFGERSAHTLTLPGDYLDLLAPHAQRTVPGEQFAYNNSGFVVLSIVIERLTGSFHRAVQDRVLDPAGMASSGFFRSDALPAEVAVGYLKDGRTNVFHLPVIGAGDGGVYLTLDDTMAFWHAVRFGKIVGHDSLAAMTAVVTDRGDKASYGRGFWLDGTGDHVWLEGMDAGVSSQTGFIASQDMTYAVLANTSSGAWPLVRAILTERG